VVEGEKGKTEVEGGDGKGEDCRGSGGGEGKEKVLSKEAKYCMAWDRLGMPELRHGGIERGRGRRR